MKILVAALGALAIICPTTWADGDAKDQPPGGLSVAIVPGKDDTGKYVIDRQREFQVVFRNQSPKPIRIWVEDCRLGHESLSFRYEEEAGKPELMRRIPSDSSRWKNTPLKTVAIPAGGALSWPVNPSGISWGDYDWTGAPEPNTGKTIKLRAVFEIHPTDASKDKNVWTGKITSEPVTLRVVDDKLKTPLEYLDARCPKQALAIMKADPTWVKKKDENELTPLHIAARNGFIEVAKWLLSNGADVNATAYNNFTPLHFASDPEMVRLLVKSKANLDAVDVTGTALQDAASKFAHFEPHPDLATEREKWRTITQILVKAGATYDLRSACYLDDLARVQALMKDKTQARDKYAMVAAAGRGRAKIVKLLLENGADPEDADYGGLTVSYFAIEHPDVLKVLFDAGANPKVSVTYRGNGPGPQGSNLLRQAVEKGSIDSAKLLLTYGLNVGDPALLSIAARRGNIDMVDWLIKNKANVKNGGRDAMSVAAFEIRPEHDEDNLRFRAMIRRLQQAGVELDLFAAIACDDVRRLAEILKADPKLAGSTCWNGLPALHCAVTLDRREMVKLLLDKGCDPDIRSKSGTTGHNDGTALLAAAFWGRPEIAATLIQRGAKVNATAAKGVVPLHEAARMGQIEIAELLLKHGADVNAKDQDGTTPLDWATSYKEITEMMKLLRKHGGQTKQAPK